MPASAQDFANVLGALGYDDAMGADEMGARMPSIKALRQQIAPGVQRFGARRKFLGLPSIVWTAGSQSTQTVKVTPQKPISIRKLVADVTRIGATSNGAVTIDAVLAGSANQNISNQPVPVALFGQFVQGNFLDLDALEPGVEFTIVANCSVIPGAGDSVQLNIGAIVDTTT